ncbi:hypothetical protein H6P81_003201 [Aristolochia fimbriata]|uniref:Small EDRK-rich factor-like N-terminal domain-containing protein n=1 Tax=Aristolochia fimbriata TaxID=158543 RepID=A0AAV7FC40_ARIFI|nr:hypothetical protein H6P81_003201 [Aristolochia fimbriata]
MKLRLNSPASRTERNQQDEQEEIKTKEKLANVGKEKQSGREGLGERKPDLQAMRQQKREKANGGGSPVIQPLTVAARRILSSRPISVVNVGAHHRRDWTRCANSEFQFPR